MPTFGPGTLTLGATGSTIDCSAYINGARITANKDQGEATTKLSGAVKPGSVKYAWEFTGNIDTDTDRGEAGLFALSQTDYGKPIAFTFTPNSEDETVAAGTLILDPLDFGADAYGDDQTSDFTWAIVDKPAYTYADGAVTVTVTE